MTIEVIGKPTMGLETKLLLVPELIEAAEGKVAEDEVTQEVADENQTNLDHPVVFRSSAHDATGVIPAKLVGERKSRIPGNVMFGAHETEFEEPGNFLLQGRPPRSPGRVSVSYTHLDVYKRRVLYIATEHRMISYVVCIRAHG